MKLPRGLLATLLGASLALAPAVSYGQDEPPTTHKKKKKKKKKHKTAPPETLESTPPEDASKPEDATETTTAPEKKAPVEEISREGDEEDDEDAIASPLAPYLPEIPTLSTHRYAYIGGGILALGGLAFAYSAQGQAKRAETITAADEAAQMLDQARASAATANVLYGMAFLTITYAVLMEILPEPAAEKASLTFHF
jgi:hypothetical protein